MKSNNAPRDWNPTGAAFESASDSTTLADDWKLAVRALGVREVLDDLRDPREWAMALFGGAVVVLGMLLLCLGA